MRAEFDKPSIIDNILLALFLVMIVAMVIIGFSYGDDYVMLFLPCAVYVVIMFILSAFHGEIIADEKGVTVVTIFFGITVGKKFVEYNDIDCTDCVVVTKHSRLRGVYHTIEFTLKMKNDSIITVLKQLDIEASFPAEQPDKYKEYLHNQPLMQISHYIDNKLHLNTSA